MQKFRFSLTSLLGSVFVAAIGCAALARPTEAWATAVVSMSVGVLFVALVRLIYVERARRAFWVGFAICGWGYLLMARVVMTFPGADADLLVTSRLLQSLAQATLGEDPSIPYSAGPVYAPPASYTSVPTSAGASITYLEYPENTGVEAPLDAPVPAESTPSLSQATTDPLTTTFEPFDIEQPPTPLAPPTASYPVATVMTSPADPGAWQRLMHIGQYLWALLLGFAGGLLACFFQVRASRRNSKAEKSDRPAAESGGGHGGE
jgi:hypothetical protein